MIKRSGTKANTARVTFELPSSVGAVTACVSGEFNDWSSEGLPMTRMADGRFEATVELAAGRRWRFRYVLDGTRWENDWAADDYVANEFAGEDSVVDLSALPTAPPDDRREPSHRSGAPVDEEAAAHDMTATKATTKKAATKKAATKKAATQKAAPQKAAPQKAATKKAATKKSAATKKAATTTTETPAKD